MRWEKNYRSICCADSGRKGSEGRAVPRLCMCRSSLYVPSLVFNLRWRHPILKLSGAKLTEMLCLLQDLFLHRVGIPTMVSVCTLESCARFAMLFRPTLLHNSTVFISVNVRLLLRNNAKAGYLGDCLLGAQNRLQRQQRWKSVSVLWTTRIGDCYSWTESDQVTIPIRAEIGWIGNRRNEDARGWKFGREDLAETFGIWTHPRALLTRASYL